MKNIYLVIIDNYHDEENSVVNICSNLEKAEELKSLYEKRTKNTAYKYHIDIVDVEDSEDILWDCYDNTIF